LRCGCHAHKFVRCDELQAVAFLDALVQGVTVISGALTKPRSKPKLTRC
jgi:hypothetical protein